jgi:hypothetical protein
MFNRFSGYADNGGMSIEKAAPRKKPKTTRFAGYAGVDEEGYIPNEKRELMKRDEVGITMSDTDNPYYKMIDEEALALQAQTGESYASCFTKAYTDPSNKTIVDQIQFSHLAQNYDAMFGYGLATPVKKAAPPDPPQDSPGPAHDALNELIMGRMKADPELSYQRAFTNEYTHPKNRSLKQRVDAESIMHAQRLASGKPFPSYGHPGDVRGGGRVGRTVGREGRGGQDF